MGDFRLRRYFASLLIGLIASTASARENDISNATQTVGGIYGSLYIHELGHALVFKAFGATDISIQVPRKGEVFNSATTANFPSLGLSNSQLQIVSASGLLTANLAGEIVLQNNNFYGSPFAQSILGTALISNVMHVYGYYTKVRGVNGYAGNDIDSFELAGGNPHVFSAVLIAYTAWSLQRMQKNEIPLFYLNLKY